MLLVIAPTLNVVVFAINLKQGSIEGSSIPVATLNASLSVCLLIWFLTVMLNDFVW